MLFKYPKDSDFQWFQIRILHRILLTNYILTEMNIKANQLCTFCNQETETLLHLFWECRVFQDFWRNFRAYMRCKNVITEDWDIKNILFGIENCNPVMNLLIIRAKMFIYHRKYEESTRICDNFKLTLKGIYQIGKYNAVKTRKLTNFEKNVATLKSFNLIW